MAANRLPPYPIRLAATPVPAKVIPSLPSRQKKRSCPIAARRKRSNRRSATGRLALTRRPWRTALYSSPNPPPSPSNQWASPSDSGSLSLGAFFSRSCNAILSQPSLSPSSCSRVTSGRFRPKVCSVLLVVHTPQQHRHQSVDNSRRLWFSTVYPANRQMVDASQPCIGDNIGVHRLDLTGGDRLI